MQLPKILTGNKGNSEASYKKYQKFRNEVETTIETIKKMPERKERLAAYEAVSDKLHTLYGDKPKLMNSKTAAWAAGGGALAGVGVTAAVAGSFVVPFFSIPAITLFGLAAAGTGAAAGGGIGGVVGNFKEMRKQRKEHGTVENAREIHRIIGLVDNEISIEKASLSSQDRDELLTKKFNQISGETKKPTVTEVPAPKEEAPFVVPDLQSEIPAATKPAAPAKKPVTKPRPAGTYKKITNFNKTKKGPQQ